MKKDNVFMT